MHCGLSHYGRGSKLLLILITFAEGGGGGGGEPEDPEKNPRGRVDNQRKLNPLGDDDESPKSNGSYSSGGHIGHRQ